MVIFWLREPWFAGALWPQAVSCSKVFPVPCNKHTACRLQSRNSRIILEGGMGRMFHGISSLTLKEVPQMDLKSKRSVLIQNNVSHVKMENQQGLRRIENKGYGILCRRVIFMLSGRFRSGIWHIIVDSTEDIKATPRPVSGSTMVLVNQSLCRCHPQTTGEANATSVKGTAPQRWFERSH